MTANNRVQNRRILVIDDNPAIHADIRKILLGDTAPNAAMEDAKAQLFGSGAPASALRTTFEIDSAYQGEEGLQKVEEAVKAGRPYAVAFVDVRMPPGWDGVETIVHMWEAYPELQVVICTAYSDYSWADMVRQIGTTDSLVILKKPFDNIEVMQLAHTLTEKWGLTRQVNGRLNTLDSLVNQRTAELLSATEKLKSEIAERMRMEKILALSEDRFSKAFMASPIPLAIRSLLQEKYVDANAGFVQITGYDREELVGKTPLELNLWENPDVEQKIMRILREEMSVRNLTCRLRHKSQEMRNILLSVELFELADEPFLLLIAQDLTEQIKLENQTLQTKKLEAVGQLAAGVAHDFNNILTIVQGNACLLLDDNPPPSPQNESLNAIYAASERAGKLVRQLLTFSRRQVRQPRIMDLANVIHAVGDMLPRLIGQRIKVELKADSGTYIHADPGMMEQMVMNLAVNARDAMPDGGTLAIGSESVEIKEGAALRHPEARAGKFICLKVRDTGCGMHPEILERIFEPFYTTKPVGKGAGLGLATVYGIAKQHEGWIEVQTEVGKGSAFMIFLPASQSTGMVNETGPKTVSLRGKQEWIFVVEDEEDVRRFVVALLRANGYNVLEAGSGPEALDKWAAHEHDIQLLLTDMVMPGGISGRVLAERLLAMDPGMRVVYTSGYSPGMAGKEMALLEGRNFLAKPYAPNALLAMVRQMLDQKPNSAPEKIAN